MQGPPHLHKHKGKSSNLVTSPKNINFILEKFYASLYGADSIDETTAISFLDRVLLPIMNDTLLTQLNAPVSLIEITGTIKTLSPGKAQGPDGYISDFHKLSIDIIAPTLRSVYKKILDGLTLS